jgi:hypothetical protein
MMQTERFKEYQRKYQREYKQQLKLEIFKHYGNRCTCCGETEPLFLTIHHRNNDGSKHRREVGKGNMVGSNLYFWIRANHYPESLTLLCWNCNAAIGRHGFCPHHPE